MSTIITSESQDSEWRICSLEENMKSLEYMTNIYERNMGKSKNLRTSIKDQKASHQQEIMQMERKLRHIEQDFDGTQDTMHDVCNTRLSQVKSALKPYLSKDNVEESLENGRNLKSRLIEVLSKISRLEENMKESLRISKIAQQDHNLLSILEAKQNNAIRRFEDISRLQNLTYDVNLDDPLYNLIQSPTLLLLLSGMDGISGYYRDNLKALQQRLCAFVAQIRYNSQHVFGSQLESTQMSNGEISIDSLVDATEHPVDSLTSAISK